MSGLFLQVFLLIFLYISLSHMCYMTHLILHDFIILIIFDEAYKSWSSSLSSLLQPPVTSSLFHPNILLSSLLSNTLNLCSSFYCSMNQKTLRTTHVTHHKHNRQDSNLLAQWTPYSTLAPLVHNRQRFIGATLLKFIYIHRAGTSSQ